MNQAHNYFLECNLISIKNQLRLIKRVEVMKVLLENCERSSVTKLNLDTEKIQF